MALSEQVPAARNETVPSEPTEQMEVLVEVSVGARPAEELASVGL